jgi:ferric-dicitrate binding protein FerR (iron transport regulator)
MARAMAAIQPRRTAWRVAAVLVGAALCTGLYWYFHKKPVTESTTQYGEMRTLYLPDSSKVILNAHSSLHYAWVPGGTREIWLEGEAYFDVRPVKNSVFLVHAGKLSVEVLGTRFDIRDRRGKVVVVLEEGKIRVRYLDSALVLTPGEEVLLDTAKVAVTKAPDNYTTWKEKRLTDVTVADIAEYLEDNYHKKVILQDPAMARRRIGGVVLLDNLDDALFALSTVLNAEIIQSGDTLVVRPK